MSNLTDLLPAGAGGKQVDFVATGNLPNGVPVALKTDGTVVAITGSSATTGLGTQQSWSSEEGFAHLASICVGNIFIVAFYDINGSPAYQGKVVAGVVSGSTISFGSLTTFYSGRVGTRQISLAYSTTDSRLVIVFANNDFGDIGQQVTCSLSGTSITVLTRDTFYSGEISDNSVVYDATEDKIVITYEAVGNSRYGQMVLYDPIAETYSTTYVWLSNRVKYTKAVYDPDEEKVVVFYSALDTAQHGQYIVATVNGSGNTISFGSIGTFVSAQVATGLVAAYDSGSNKMVVAWFDGDNSFVGRVIVGTVSGSTMSFGSVVTFESGQYNDYISIAYNPIANKVVIAYTDYDSISAGNNYGTALIGTVNGTSISFESPLVYNAENTLWNTISYSSTGTMAIAYRKSAGDAKAKVLTVGYVNSNNTDFIGITDAAISDTATGSVTIKGGISTNVTGLTPNQNYYVQINGTLSTTTSSVLAGKALSSTSINLDYTT
jgi:hypothetical protein